MDTAAVIFRETPYFLQFVDHNVLDMFCFRAEQVATKSIQELISFTSSFF